MCLALMPMTATASCGGYIQASRAEGVWGGGHKDNGSIVMDLQYIVSDKYQCWYSSVIFSDTRVWEYASRIHSYLSQFKLQCSVERLQF